jgi:hypothetical protein
MKIRPSSAEERFRILSNLAEGVGRRMGFTLSRYDVSTNSDSSDSVHWMYRFDEHESRIYRVQNGFQRIGEIKINEEAMIDLVEAEFLIRNAILEVNEKSVR